MQVTREQNAMPARPGARRRRPGELEAEVLAALQGASGPVTAGWVRDHFNRGLAYTTVVTILTRLQAKQAVARFRSGRSFRWTATADRTGLAARRMRRELEGESDRRAVLACFLAELPPDDEEVLRRRLKRTGPIRGPTCGSLPED